MNHELAREIIRGCDLGLSGWLLISLLFHNFSTDIPELDTCVSKDTVIDAVVAGLVASGHAGVGGVDDGITFKRRNVALPEI